jgi:hypothetical protein
MNLKVGKMNLNFANRLLYLRQSEKRSTFNEFKFANLNRYNA